MRTNIEIDDELMAEAMKAGGYATKRETVEAGLRILTQRKKAYSAALALGGKIDWVGDLDMQRRDIVAEPAPAYAARKPAAKAAKRARK